MGNSATKSGGLDKKSYFKRQHKALHVAVECGSYKVLKFLIKAGHDVNSADEDGHTPLMTSLIQICLDGKKELKKKDLKIPKILLKSGAKVKIADKKGMTSLHYAAYISSPKLIKLLLKYKGASSINKLDSFNASPLHYVTRSMKLHFVKNTLSKKSSGKPKLFEPTAENQMECMRLLIARGADVNHKNKCGINVFHDVFENSKLWEFIQYLLDQEYVVDYQDKRLIRLMKLGHGMPNIDILLRHTAVCKNAPKGGKRIKRFDITKLHEDCQKYYEQCLIEIECMKKFFKIKEKLLCKILMGDAKINKKTRRLFKIATTVDIRQCFPIYGDFLINRLKKIVKK